MRYASEGDVSSTRQHSVMWHVTEEKEEEEEGSRFRGLNVRGGQTSGHACSNASPELQYCTIADVVAVGWKTLSILRIDAGAVVRIRAKTTSWCVESEKWSIKTSSASNHCRRRPANVSPIRGEKAARADPRLSGARTRSNAFPHLRRVDFATANTW